MKEDIQHIQYFGFHDAYFKDIEVNVDKNELIWYLEGVNVSSKCDLNPFEYDMRAGTMKMTFADYELCSDIDLDKIYQENYEILDSEKLNMEEGKYRYRFLMYEHPDFIELTISFCSLTFEWDTYEDKAWYE